MSETARKQLQSLLNRKRFMRDNRILFAKLNRPQQRFMDAVSESRKDRLPRRLIFPGPNKIGKTSVGVLRGISLALGEHPFLPEDHPLRRLHYWPVPNVGLVVGEQLTQSVDKKLVPEYLFWLPKICDIDTKKNQQGVIVKITVNKDLHGDPLGSIIHFRCHDDQTEVLTDSGWKQFMDVDKSFDRLMTVNMNTGYLEWQRPLAVYSYRYKGTMIHGKSQNLDYMVTPTHNMLVCNYKPRGYAETWGLKPFISLSARDATPRSFKWHGKEKDIMQFPWGASVRYAPAEDWVAFCGIYIAEGGNSGSEVYICQKDGTKARDEIRELLDRLPISYAEDPVRFRIYNTQLSRYMEQFGHGALNKRIPKMFKELDQGLLRVLVRWMVLGDGSKKVSKRLDMITSISECYYTASKQLMDDFMEVLLKIGLNGYGYERGYTGPGTFETVNPQYRVNIHTKKKTGLLCSGKSRGWFWEEVDYDGYVYCAEVPNHTLITRRNGRVLASGNSFDSAVESFEGIDMNFIHWDEPPPYPHFVAAERGLLPSDGISIMTFTSLKEPWIKDFADQSVDYGGSDKGIRVVEAGDIWQNSKENGGFMTREAISEFIKIVPKEEYNTRILGKWMQSGGVIYSSFRDEEPYVIQNFDIPRHWTKYESVDPHDAKPTRWLFAAAAPWEVTIDGELVSRIFIIDYLSLTQDMTITDMVKEVKRKRVELGYMDRDPAAVVLDAKYGSQRRATLHAEEPVNWQGKLEEAGAGYIQLSDSKQGAVEVGHKIVRAYLIPQFFRLEEREIPGLVFFDRCRGMDGPVEAMRKYRYKPHSDSPDERHKDWADTVRYLCAYRPVYIERGRMGQRGTYTPRDERAGR